MYELYSAIRGPEFALAPIPADQKEHLMRMQFRGQMSAYTQTYPNSCYHIVLLDGKPVGRLWVAQTESEFHLVDIGIHPNLQNKGIGTVLIQRLQLEATTACLPVSSSVSRFNNASLRFHQRLGFAIVREDQMYYFLQWKSRALFPG